MSNPSSKHAFCDFISYLLSSRLRPRGRHSYSGPCHSYTSAYVPRANLPAVSRKGPGAELSFQREGAGHHGIGLGLTRLLITHHLHSFARGQEQTCFYHKGHPHAPRARPGKNHLPFHASLQFLHRPLLPPRGFQNLEMNCAFVRKALGTGLSERCLT